MRDWEEKKCGPLIAWTNEGNYIIYSVSGLFHLMISINFVSDSSALLF